MNRPLANSILKIALLFFTITTVASAQLRYNGIWNKGETDHKIWVNSDWESFKKKWDELGEQGYRPVDIEVTRVGNEKKYSGLWHRGSGNYEIWVDADWESFKARFDEWAALGMHLIDWEIYVDRERHKFTGIWRAGAVQQKMVYDLNWESLPQLNAQFSAKGLNLIDIESYEKGNKREYAGIWSADGGSPALPLNFMTWAEFNTTSEAFEKNGLALVDMESFGSGKNTVFIGIWRQDTELQKLLAGADWNSYLGTWRTLQNTGYQLVDIEPTTSGGALTVTPTTPASPTTPTTSQPKIPDNNFPDTPGSTTPPVAGTNPGSGTGTPPPATTPPAETPTTGAVEFGKASYYGDNFQGRKTASGEPYDRDKLTCAHRTYPFGTQLKITNVANDRSVIVRVNDRGPHVKERVVDLSHEAAYRLDGIRSGIIDVKVEPVK